MPFPTSVDAIVDAPPVTAATRIFASHVLGPQRQLVGPIWFNPRSDLYGAKGDGVTDDSTAIQNALNDAGSGSPLGGICFLPHGTYAIGSKLTVPTRVSLIGAGRDSTTIKALGSFPINTELVRLMDTSGIIAFGCRVLNMTVDCSGISGSTGIYSERINEESGVFCCLILNYGSFGVRINQPASGNPAENYSIDDVEINSGAGTGAGAIGLAITNTSISVPIRSISRVTINATGQTQLTKAAQIDGVVGGRFADIHVENAVTGVLVGSVVACSSCVFENINGAQAGTVGTLMTWSNATTQHALTAIALNNPANQLNDQINGFTINAAEQQLGFYALGVGAVPKPLVHTARGQPTRIGNDLGSVGAAPTLGALQTGISTQSIAGTDLSGTVTLLTTGAGVTAPANIAIVNFARTKTAAPVVFFLSQSGADSGKNSWYSSGQGTTSFNISTNANLAINTTYTIGYMVIGT